MNPTKEEVIGAVRMILADKAKYATSLNYAVAYCRAASDSMSDKELAVQCLYILSNITHWRNPNGKYVRATLKAFAANN